MICLALNATSATGSESVTPEPADDTYNFVSHYRVNIAAPVELVWPVLMDLKSWMYEFELLTVAGEQGSEGQVLRLYAGQDFMIQLTKVIPNELLSFVNLPLTFREELATGVSVITLQETTHGSSVSVTMSRRYTWQGEGENPLRTTRETAEFHKRTDAMWQDRFLTRLKALAEGDTP